MDDPRFLTGQFLLAMPGMSDPRFDRAVILMAAHDEEGALGVGVGRLLPGMKLRDLLRQLDIDPGEAPDLPVHHGGPVEPGRGFVLHSLDWAGQDSVQVADVCGLTGTLDVLKAIATGRGPSRFIVSLGYAGWDAGQLDEEMTRHGWFAARASDRLLFHSDTSSRWQDCFAAQGIDPSLIVGESGAA